MYYSHDSLTIYNDEFANSAKKQSGHPVCGDTNPSQFVSSSKVMFFEFIADSYTNDRGFRIRFEKTGKFVCLFI